MATSSSSSSTSTTAMVAKGMPTKYADAVTGFLSAMGIAESDPETTATIDFSDLVSHLLKADLVQPRRVSCTFSVLPVVTNFYNGLHGGAVAAVAERISTGCARTAVAEDKELFLGDLSISYLSAAQQNDVLTVDGSVVRSGRNMTMVATEFRIKKTGKIVYTARATFYHMPVAKL